MIGPFITHSLIGGNIIVNIPDQRPVLVPLVVDDVLVDMQPPTGFRPNRIIANLVIVSPEFCNDYLIQLPYPVEIKVRYHPWDYQAADGIPALAFWDGKEWVIFSAKHNYTMITNPDPRTGGEATITIAGWIDPPMAWGT